MLKWSIKRLPRPQSEEKIIYSTKLLNGEKISLFKKNGDEKTEYSHGKK